MDRKWLVTARNKSKFTHQDVADRAGIDRSFYTQIENGSRNPSVETAKKIAIALEFDWTLFFEQTSGERQQKASTA